jgi:hypothetical protein
MADRRDLPAPDQGLVITHFLTVRDVSRARDFYATILGGDVVLEENPAIVKVANSSTGYAADHRLPHRVRGGRDTGGVQ